MPIRRIYAEMDILDVLEHYIDRESSELKHCAHQYSACALMMRKIRSTSATFCKTP